MKTSNQGKANLFWHVAHLHRGRVILIKRMHPSPKHLRFFKVRLTMLLEAR
jgi:hypothetical protein